MSKTTKYRVTGYKVIPLFILPWLVGVIYLLHLAGEVLP